MDSTTQDAELFRRAIGTLLGPAGGIVSPGDLTVTQQGTPNMSVQIGVGQIWVPGTSTTTQGPYYSRNSAATTVAISASNPTNPRVDTIIAQVQDAAYAGSNKQLAPAVVVGTPTAGATLANLLGVGTVPASSYVIAYVLVPANATSIVTADIANVASVVSRATGAWTALTLITSPGSGVTAAPNPPMVRLEADTVRFKGGMINNTGGTLNNAQWATLPTTLFYPPAFRGPPCNVSGSPASLNVGLSGAVSVIGSWANGTQANLDGATYSLT